MTTSECAKNFGKVMLRILQGERITLTSHGTPIAVLSPVGGLESHETNHESAGGTTRGAGLNTRPDGRVPQDGAKRNIKNGVGRVAAKRRHKAVGQSVSPHGS